MSAYGQKRPYENTEFNLFASPTMRLIFAHPVLTHLVKLN